MIDFWPEKKFEQFFVRQGLPPRHFPRVRFLSEQSYIVPVNNRTSTTRSWQWGWQWWWTVARVVVVMVAVVVAVLVARVMARVVARAVGCGVARAVARVVVGGSSFLTNYP
jgi:hypothetical protein